MTLLSFQQLYFYDQQICNLLQYHHYPNVKNKSINNYEYLLLLSISSSLIAKSYSDLCYTSDLCHTLPLVMVSVLCISHILLLCLINYQQPEIPQEDFFMSKQKVGQSESIKINLERENFQEDRESSKEITFQSPRFSFIDKIQKDLPWLQNKNFILINQDRKIIDHSNLEQYLFDTLSDKKKSKCRLEDLFLESTSQSVSLNLSEFMLIGNVNDSSIDQKKQSFSIIEGLSPKRQSFVNFDRNKSLFQIFTIILKKQHPSIQQIYALQDVKSQYFDLSNMILNFIVTERNKSQFIVLWFQKMSPISLSLERSIQNNSPKINDSYSQQLITNIFSSVSHEFGTYLNCLLSLATMGCTDPQVTEELKGLYFSPMRINGYLLNFILSNIRDFNLKLLNQFALKISEFNIKEQILFMVKELDMLFKSRNNQIIVKINIDDQSNSSINNDVERFRQILYQLLSNAIRFTIDGAITIEVSYFDHKSKDNYKISVSDTGIGMTQPEQLKLNALLKDSYKLIKVSSNSVGCGLGLSISNLIGQSLSGPLSKGITFVSNQIGTIFTYYVVDSKYTGIDGNHDLSILRFNSNIYWESQNSYTLDGNHQKERIWQIRHVAGRSSIQLENQLSDLNLDRNQQFRLHKTLNLQDQRQSLEFHCMQDLNDSQQLTNIKVPNENYKSTNFVLKYDWRGKCCSRILIVDDEYFNILSLQMILRKYDTKIEYAFNGKSALEIVQQKNNNPCDVCGNRGFTIYFLDINMPIMDGIETVQRLKLKMNLGQIQRGICIANTGFVDLETKLKCIKEGMDFYISKPIIIKELDKFLKDIFN